MNPESVVIIGLICVNMILVWKLSNELGEKVISVAQELDQNMGKAIQTILENGFGGGDPPNLLQGLAVEWFKGLKDQQNKPRGDNGRFIQAEIIDPEPK